MSPSFRQVGLNAVLDQNPEKPSPCCIVCGTWVCRECWSFRRPYARYDEPAHHICGGCGGIDGFFLATRHTHWKANKPFFVNGYRHRVMPRTPFEVPQMSISNPWACPAGDPCPGTGCPACCPSYDPCGKAGCNSCKVESMHVPEEANIQREILTAKEAIELSENEAREQGFLPPRPTAKEAIGLSSSDSPGYPFKDTDDTIVIGPECFSQPDRSVISWQGENYYKRLITDEDRKLIAANSKATIERRDRERAKKLLREMALHHAVEIHKAGVNSSPEVTVTADGILRWLMQE